MEAGDAAWLHMDRPNNRMIVNSVMWFDEPLDWDVVRDLLQERLVKRFPHFSQRVVEQPGYAWWKDVENFDLDKHLIHATLPGDSGQRELQRYVSGTLHQTFDLNLPLWELHLIDGYNGKGSAILARIHHCIADGIALSRVMMSLTDDPSDADRASVLDAAAAVHVSLLPSLVHRTEVFAGNVVHLAGNLAGDVVHPTRAIDVMSHSASSARTLAKLLALPPDAHTSLRGKAGLHKRAIWSDPIALGDIKASAHAADVTVNDLVLAAVSGALRSYLTREDGQAPDVRAVMPVNLRPLNEPLPAELGNRFGLSYLQLPLSTDDPHERLAAVHRRAAAIKNSTEGAVTFTLLDLMGHTPYGFEQLLVDLFADKGTVVITNVPGPRQAVFLAGRRVRGTIGWPPESGNLGLGVSIISYAGELIIGLMCDIGLVRDPQFILGEITRALDKFMAAAPSRAQGRSLRADEGPSTLAMATAARDS